MRDRGKYRQSNPAEHLAHERGGGGFDQFADEFGVLAIALAKPLRHVANEIRENGGEIADDDAAEV